MNIKYPPFEDWPEQRKRHQQEQYDLVLAAMEAAGWSLRKAAKSLNTAPGTLRRVVMRYPDLRAAWCRQKGAIGRGPAHAPGEE